MGIPTWVRCYVYNQVRHCDSLSRVCLLQEYAVPSTAVQINLSYDMPIKISRNIRFQFLSTFHTFRQPQQGNPWLGHYYGPRPRFLHFHLVN
jgi:hypothetical protein